MAKLSTKAAINKMKQMDHRSKGVIMDMGEMTEDEKSLFFACIEGSINAMNQNNPIMQIMQMETYFVSVSKSALFLAGMFVMQYRELQGVTEAPEI